MKSDTGVINIKIHCILNWGNILNTVELYKTTSRVLYRNTGEVICLRVGVMANAFQAHALAEKVRILHSRIFYLSDYISPFLI